MSNSHASNLEYYLSMEYQPQVNSDLDYDYSLYFIARYAEFPGLVGMGDTKEQAIHELEDFKKSWIEKNIELERHIPLPKATG